MGQPRSLKARADFLILNALLCRIVVWIFLHRRRRRFYAARRREARASGLFYRFHAPFPPAHGRFVQDVGYALSLISPHEKIFVSNLHGFFAFDAGSDFGANDWLAAEEQHWNEGASNCFTG